MHQATVSQPWGLHQIHVPRRAARHTIPLHHLPTMAHHIREDETK